MADRLVHLELHLLGVEHDRRDPGRAGGRPTRSASGLLGDPRRLALERRATRRTPSRPARSSRRGSTGSSASARARRRRRARRSRRRTRRTPGGGRRPRRRRRRAARAGRARTPAVTSMPGRAIASSARRQSAIFSSSGTSIGSRSTGGPVLARRRRRRRQVDRRCARATRARAREGDCSAGGLACALVREAPVAGEAPGAAARARERRSPRLSPSETESTSRFFVETLWERRVSARASA